MSQQVLGGADPLPVILAKPSLKDQVDNLGTLLEALLEHAISVAELGEADRTFGNLIDRAFDRDTPIFISNTKRALKHAWRVRCHNTHARIGLSPNRDSEYRAARQAFVMAIVDFLSHLDDVLLHAVLGLCDT